MIVDVFFFDVELDEILFYCIDEVRIVDVEFMIIFDGVNYFFGLVFQVEEVVLQDLVVIEVMVQWCDCFELFVSFLLWLICEFWIEMFLRFVVMVWGVIVDGIGMFFVEEIVVVMVDVECCDFSGFVGIKYERSWDEQQNFVDQNCDKFDCICEVVVECKVKLFMIVVENVLKVL